MLNLSCFSCFYSCVLGSRKNYFDYLNLATTDVPVILKTVKIQSALGKERSALIGANRWGVEKQDGRDGGCSGMGRGNKLAKECQVQEGDGPPAVS